MEDGDDCGRHHQIRTQDAVCMSIGRNCSRQFLASAIPASWQSWWEHLNAFKTHSLFYTCIYYYSETSNQVYLDISLIETDYLLLAIEDHPHQDETSKGIPPSIRIRELINQMIRLNELYLDLCQCRGRGRETIIKDGNLALRRKERMKV